MGPRQCEEKDTEETPSNPTRSTIRSEDVKLAMVKAKRVASNLWLVLHSKHCRNANCCYLGCKETKLVLLHIKCCPAAAQNRECAAQECNQARKLLNHHRQCREARLSIARRQAAALEPSSLSCRPVEPPSCLVCSMVARYVSNILEHGPGSAPVSLVERPGGAPKRSDSSSFMPPPPPRRPRSTSVPTLNEISSVSGGRASAAVAEMVSKASGNIDCPRLTTLSRQRSSSDGMLCKMSSCETIFEETVEKNMPKSAASG